MSSYCSVENSKDELYVSFPCYVVTAGLSWRVMIKESDNFYSEGERISPEQKVTKNHYIKWRAQYELPAGQRKNIGKTIRELTVDEWVGSDCDLLIGGGGEKTSIDKTFINYKGDKKAPYELSEILLYSFEKNYCSKEQIQKCYSEIKSIQNFIDEKNITRTQSEEITFNELSFYEVNAKNPFFVHKFENSDIYAKIVIPENSDVGVCPVLRVCIPLSNLQFETDVFGRTLNENEHGKWIIKQGEALIVLEIFKLFGMLTKEHKHDVLAIFKVLFDFLE